MAFCVLCIPFSSGGLVPAPDLPPLGSSLPPRRPRRELFLVRTFQIPPHPPKKKEIKIPGNIECETNSHLIKLGLALDHE